VCARKIQIKIAKKDFLDVSVFISGTSVSEAKLVQINRGFYRASPYQTDELF
jgi:hypothetical protein